MINDLDSVHQMRGVKLVLTAADLSEFGDVPCEIKRKNKDGTPLDLIDIPILCVDQVRYVGDALAVVIAESQSNAEEALETLDIEYAM